MRYKVYILRSLRDNKHYIGHTNDLNRRILEHNKGKIKSTKYRRPLILVYSEEYDSKQEAYRREMEIKSYKGGNEFKGLINEGSPPPRAGSR